MYKRQHKSAVEIDIGTDTLINPPLLGDDLGGQPFHQGCLLYTSENTLLTRMHSMPFGKTGADYLNQVELTEGRLPEKAGECVVEESIMGGNPVSIGDKMCIRDRRNGYRAGYPLVFHV